MELLANFNSAPYCDVIRLDLTFHGRPSIDVYLRFDSDQGDPLFYFSYTHPAMGWKDRYIPYHGEVVKAEK